MSQPLMPTRGKDLTEVPKMPPKATKKASKKTAKKAARVVRDPPAKTRKAAKKGTKAAVRRAGAKRAAKNTEETTERALWRQYACPTCPAKKGDNCVNVRKDAGKERKPHATRVALVQ